MKKVLAVFILTLSLSGFTYAQPAFTFIDGNIQALATEQTRSLTNQIGIHEYEYIQVKKLNEGRLLEIKEAQLEYEDQEILELNIRDINKQFEQAILTYLDTRQKKAYQHYKQTNKQTIFTASIL